MQREPHQFGLSHSRWSLQLIQQIVPWLQELSLPSVHRLLKRLRIVWKRPRASIRSPDAEYQNKLDQIALHLGQARTSDVCRVLFLDEVTIERQPTLAMAYAPRGAEQARARLSHAANTLTRIVATLDALSGRVVWQRAAHITVAGLVGFYRKLCEAYPDVDCLYVVQDNWPVHTHPDLLVALQPQTTPFAFRRPSNWPTTPSASAERKWAHLRLPIQIVPLPTYASWCNPIEKLWRWLRQQLTHLHPWADDLATFRQQLDSFLNTFHNGSLDLLRYVGLSTESFL